MRVREVVWDALSFAGSHWGRLAPDEWSARVRLAADRLQRPRLAVHRTAGEIAAIHAGNDGPLRADVAGVLGAEAGPPDRSIERLGLTLEAVLALGDADAYSVEIERSEAGPFARAGWLVLPRWVHFAMDLGMAEPDLWDETRRERVRRIERSPLRAETASDERAVAEFYDEMYAPTARIRHGSNAHVRSRAFVRRVANAGRILFVVDGDTGARLAGIVLVRRVGDAGWIDAWLAGVREGDYEGVGRLAREALYVFATRWARDEAGATTLGLTAAAPFARGGLFRFKKSWGARAYLSHADGRALAIHVARATDALAARLAEAPLVHVAGRGLAATAFAAEPPLVIRGIDDVAVLSERGDALVEAIRGRARTTFAG